MPPSGVSNNSILVAQVGPIVVPPSFFAAGGATLAGNGQVSNTNVNPDINQGSGGASPLAVAAQNTWNSAVNGLTNIVNTVTDWVSSLSSQSTSSDPANAIFAKLPSNANDPNGPKAPGPPGSDDGFTGPKNGPNWVPNPNGFGNGWQYANGDVWVPTGPGGSAHGGPHWDVQSPGGGYVNIYPGGNGR